MLLSPVLLFVLLFAQHAFTPAEISEGERLFQSNCSGCHGTAGDQVPGVALMSGKFRRATTDEDVADHPERHPWDRDAGIQFHRPAVRNDGCLPAIERGKLSLRGYAGAGRCGARPADFRRQRPMPQLSSRWRKWFARRTRSHVNWRAAACACLLRAPT